jgi:hypothetical protein
MLRGCDPRLTRLHCRIMPARRSIIVPLAIAMLLPAAVISGCQSSSRISAENDRLRRRVLEMEGEVAALKGRNQELLTELQKPTTAPDLLPQEIRENFPHVGEIAIGRLSYAADSNGDGAADLLKIYIEPRDGMGRFLQIVGRVGLHAAVLRPETDAITIGRKMYEPREVREAYRAPMMGGSYYAFELPLTLPAGAEMTQCTVSATFFDGITDQEFQTQKVIQLKAH